MDWGIDPVGPGYHLGVMLEGAYSHYLYIILYFTSRFILYIYFLYENHTVVGRNKLGTDKSQLLVHRASQARHVQKWDFPYESGVDKSAHHGTHHMSEITNIANSQHVLYLTNTPDSSTIDYNRHHIRRSRYIVAKNPKYLYRAQDINTTKSSSMDYNMDYNRYHIRRSRYIVAKN